MSRQDPTDVAPGPSRSTRTEKGGTLPRARGPRNLFDVIWETYSGYRQDRGLLLSSALAYYALFAMGPLVMVSIAVVDFAIGEQQASGQFYVSLERLLGAELAGVIDSAMGSALGSRYSTTFTIIGAGFLVYGAVRLFLRLQLGSNMMWGVRVNQRVESKKLIISRLWLLPAAFIPGVLIVVSVFLGSVVSWLQGPFGLGFNVLVKVAETGAPAVVSWLALAALFRLLPDVLLSWRDVWKGSLVTALGLTAGTNLFGVYMTWGGSSSFYGAAGAILALLLWTHYMALIVVAGMRLSRVLYERAGNPIRPAPYAVVVHEVILAGHDEPGVPKDRGVVG